MFSSLPVKQFNQLNFYLGHKKARVNQRAFLEAVNTKTI